MEEMNNNMGAPVKETGKLSSASLDGLLLALVTIVCSVIGSLGVGGGFVGVLIWIIKLVATIWVLLFFMKRYSLRHASIYGETTYNQAFGYGFLVSLLSAVVIACFMYLSVTVLFPNTESDTMQKIQDTIAQQGNSLGEEQENAINTVMNNLPMILTFGMLIWCTIMGLIISAIIASSVKQLPVEGFNPNNFDANNFNPDSFNNDAADSETAKPEDITPDKTEEAKPEEPADKPEDPNDKYMPK